MAIPLVSNQRKIDASGSDRFDPIFYRQLIGLLMYMVNTQPDITFAVKSLSHFMVDPRRVHWTAVKHILHYIRGTMEYGLVYEFRGSVQLAGFIDVDWAGCVQDQRSTSGCCFIIGSGVVSWLSRKQKSFTLSSTEAEYMVAIMAACEGMWLRKLHGCSSVSQRLQWFTVTFRVASDYLRIQCSMIRANTQTSGTTS